LGLRQLLLKLPCSLEPCARARSRSLLRLTAPRQPPSLTLRLQLCFRAHPAAGLARLESPYMRSALRIRLSPEEVCFRSRPEAASNFSEPSTVCPGGCGRWKPRRLIQALRRITMMIVLPRASCDLVPGPRVRKMAGRADGLGSHRQAV